MFVEGQDLLGLLHPYFWRQMPTAEMHKFDKLSYKELSIALAHGFENLLGGILGYSMILKDRFQEDPLISAEINTIIGAAQRAVDLTHMLEGYSKFEAGHKVYCDLNAIVRKGLDLVMCTLPKEIKTSCQLGEGLERVYADPAQLLQILLLLAFYARSSIREGGLITFKTHKFCNEEQDILDCGSASIENYICLGLSFVASEGMSISPNEEIHRNKLITSFGFEEFVASHKVWTRSVRHNGGLGFELYFPSSSEEIEIPQKQYATPRSIGLKDKGVLVVDDDEIIRTLPVDILSDFGTRIYSACDGREGLELFNQHRYEVDVILMDVMMPLMDGIKAFYAIRELDSRIPVIFISGYSEVKDLQPILSNEERVGFLGKPFSNQALVELILKFVSIAPKS